MQLRLQWHRNDSATSVIIVLWVCLGIVSREVSLSSDSTADFVMCRIAIRASNSVSGFHEALATANAEWRLLQGRVMCHILKREFVHVLCHICVYRE